VGGLDAAAGGEGGDGGGGGGEGEGHRGRAREDRKRAWIARVLGGHSWSARRRLFWGDKERREKRAAQKNMLRSAKSADLLVSENL